MCGRVVAQTKVHASIESDLSLRASAQTKLHCARNGLERGNWGGRHRGVVKMELLGYEEQRGCKGHSIIPNLLHCYV